MADILPLSPILWDVLLISAVSLVIAAAAGMYVLSRAQGRTRAAMRQAADQRTEAEALTRAIVETAVDGIITIDQRGTVLSVNPAAVKLFGYSATEVIGQNVSMLMPQPYRHEHDQYLRNYLDTGIPKIIGIGREVSGQRKDGSTFPMDLAVSEVVLGNRRIFAGIVHDVSQRKLQEESLRQAKESAEAANRTKDEFLATVSHELRTPLTAIVGWAQLLAGNHDDKGLLAEGIEVIGRNAKAQAQLIEDILDISRIITGRLRLKIGAVDLTAVIEAAIQTVRPAATAKDIQIATQMDNTMGAITGDSDRLQQVVWNLLSNAIKFSPRGARVVVQLSTADASATIRVRDWGKGITPEFLPYVFEPFRQADSGSTRRYGGLGLGLAIVRRLVELHGGTVHVHSDGENQGSTFSVTIPRLVPQEQAAVSPPTKAIAQKGRERSARVLAGVRVLAVDDEPDARRLIATVLQRSGAEVTAAASVSEAMLVIARPHAGHWPDVLLSDIGMPDEDGFSLIRKVRAMEGHGGRHVPAAALTAYTRMEDRLRVLSAGYQMYVPKPVEPDELVEVVANLAGRESRIVR